MKLTRLKSKAVNKDLAQFNLGLTKKDQVELVEDDEHKLIVINKVVSFFYYENKPVPALKYLQKHPDKLKQIVVDMGAIKFIVNGADIMRPGIVQIDSKIKKDEFIVIVDENNLKPIAVGIALFDGIEMKKIESGKLIKNIHFVGDEIWGK